VKALVDTRKEDSQTFSLNLKRNNKHREKMMSHPTKPLLLLDSVLFRPGLGFSRCFSRTAIISGKITQNFNKNVNINFTII